MSEINYIDNKNDVAIQLGKRLKTAISASGIDRQQFFAQLGISNSTWYNWQRGDTSPSVVELYYIADLLGVDVAWLATGEGEREPKVTQEISLSGPGVPILGTIKAGKLVEQYVAEHAEEYLSVSPESISQRSDVLFGLRVSGRSMEGVGIYDGDVAVCSVTQPVRPGDYICYYDYETGESTIKELGFINRKEIQLIAHHPDHDTVIRPLGPNDQVRKVIGVFRLIKRNTPKT